MKALESKYQAQYNPNQRVTKEEYVQMEPAHEGSKLTLNRMESDNSLAVSEVKDLIVDNSTPFRRSPSRLNPVHLETNQVF